MKRPALDQRHFAGECATTASECRIAAHQALYGTLPPSVTLDDLLAAAGELAWSRQAQMLGLVDAALAV